MIVLKCVKGRTKTGDPCDYEITYRDEAYVVRTAKRVGMFDCPACHKSGLKAYRRYPKAA
jgi:hypothetical protein